MIERILPETIYPTCAAVRAGDFVFISGEAGTDDEGNVVSGGFEAQARASIERVLKALNAAGCTPSHVVKVTVWLTDPRTSMNLMLFTQSISVQNLRRGPLWCRNSSLMQRWKSKQLPIAHSRKEIIN